MHAGAERKDRDDQFRNVPKGGVQESAPEWTGVDGDFFGRLADERDGSEDVQCGNDKDRRV